MAELGLGPSSYHSEIIPICRPISESPAQAQFTMPCYMVTLMDCFSEGGYFFPWENYLENTQLKSFIPANVFTVNNIYIPKIALKTYYITLYSLLVLVLWV